MRILFSLILLVILSGIKIEAQDTILLDQSGKVTIQGFESYYRVCDYDLITKLPNDEFHDYYAKSNKLYASGFYLNGKRHGYYTVYDINTKKSYSILYNDNAQIDTILIYDRYGKSIQLKFNEVDNNLFFYEFYDSLNNTLINNGDGMIYYQTKDFLISGEVKDYKANGDWKIITPNFTIDEKFEKGIFISGKAKENNGKYFETVISNIKYLFVNFEYFDNTENLLISDFYRKRDYPRLDSVFTPRWYLNSQSGSGFIVVEEHAEFPGGKQNLITYIQSKIEYPLEAQKNNIKGTVVVLFTINIDGQVKNPEIIESLGYGCDEIALDIIHNMPDWIPAQQRGEPVPVTFKIPIRFE